MPDVWLQEIRKIEGESGVKLVMGSDTPGLDGVTLNASDAALTTPWDQLETRIAGYILGRGLTGIHMLTGGETGRSVRASIE